MSTLQLEFALPCKPETAFAAWTESRHVTRWWGEDGIYRTVGWTADLRPGGAWRADFAGDGGAGFSAEGEYRAVEAPMRLVWTWRASWDPTAETLIDMRFAPDGDGTRLLLRQELGPTDDLAENEESWRQVVGWLAADLAAG